MRDGFTLIRYHLALLSASFCFSLLGCGAGEDSVQKMSATETDSVNSPTGNLNRAVTETAADRVSNAKDELPDLGFGNSNVISLEDSNSLPDSIPKDTTIVSEESTPPSIDNQPTKSVVDDGLLPRRRLGKLGLVTLDTNRAEAAGLVVSESKHLRLVYEPGSKDLIEDFHLVFEQAVDQWVEFFSASPKRFEDWQVTCFFIVDLAKFQNAGLIPEASFLPNGTLPPGGWEFGNQIWVNRHPGNYYNRHMLLHEGTHAFCFYNFGTLGRPWLAEGLAEHLALHRWLDKRLTLAARVADKDKLEYWGRVKLIQDAWEFGQPKSLGQVMDFGPDAFPATESYAWSWAAVMMFDQHPQLHDSFHKALETLSDNNEKVWNQQLLGNAVLTSEQLNDQWEVLVGEMTYGYDLKEGYVRWLDATTERENVAANDDFQIEIPADGAWHQTQFLLPAGEWQVEADGLFQVGTLNDVPLISTADGISLQYFNGARIGQLQAAVEAGDGFFAGSSKLTQPVELSSDQPLKVTQAGQLFLRINDHPAQLEDNQGTVTVHFSAVK